MLLSFLLIFATLTRSYQQETRSESQVLTGRGAEGLSRIPHLGLAGAAASEAVRGARAATKVPGKKGSGARYRIRLAAISGKRNADVSTLSWRTCRTPSPPPPRRPPHHTPPTTVSERPRPRPPNSTLSHSQHHPSPHKVYHQERVEEVRTEQRSSGGGKMASLNNNLSELDTLLQDLNNARYTGVFKEPAAATNGTVNGSRPTVDSLLDALDDVDTG
nr:uncharacterized protein LOC113805626 isoform X2 [Penaeus vannamei]